MDSHDARETSGTSDGTLDRRRRDRADRYLASVHSIRAFNANETGDLAFMGQPLVQLTLPHTDPGDVPFYERRNGDTALVVERGVIDRDGKTELAGIPFGVYPRLVLAWVTTEAVRTKNRSLALGGSLAAFMAELGLERGGETSTRLREQMRRLFAARIAIVKAVQGMDRTSVQVASHTRLWWDESDPSETLDMGSTIRLTDDFYRLLVDRPVPLDMRALQVLKDSPLGLDLYMWLTYRVSYLGREAVIPWTALEAQMGADYGETKNFTRKAKRELRKIKLVWPELDYATPRGRLVLKPCPPHVRPRLKP